MWGSYFVPAQWAGVSARVANFPLAIGIMDIHAIPLAPRAVLARVLPSYRLPDATIYAVYPASRQLSAKVRVFNDFMTRFFAASAIFR